MVGLILAIMPALGWAQLSYSTLIDSDNNTATGCSVTLPTATVAGIERRLTATVSPATLQVTALALENCVGNSFGPPSALSGTPYPVGLNNGVAGADVIEQAVPANLIAAPGATLRLYFAAQGPGGDDLIASVNGSPGGAPILLVLAGGGGVGEVVGIPTLTTWSLLALISLLSAMAVWRLRPGARHTGVLLLIVLGSGIVFAATLDGQTGDWAGKSPVATDPANDSASPATDLTTAFASDTNGTLFLRLDARDAQPSTPTNRPPVFNSTAPTAASVGGLYSYAISASDPDGNVLTLTAPTLPAWLTFTPGANGAGTLSGTPGAGNAGSNPVVLRVTDNGTPNLSADQSFTIAVGTVANVAPALDLNGPAAGTGFAATFLPGGGAVAIVDPASLTVTDPDGANLASATITLTNLLDAGQETLAVSAATLAPNTPITAVYTAATGVLRLTGPATLAQMQAALRTVTYINTAAAPTTTPARVISFVANDGTANSATATSTVNFGLPNAAPSFTKGPDQTANEDAGARTVSGWASAIDDGDGGTQTLTFNVTANTNPGLFAAGPAVSSAGVLSYTPAANASGTATITLTLSDDGSNTPPNVNTSAPQTFTITVSAVNDAPVFTVGPNQTVNEGAGAQTVSPWATGISPGPANEAGQTLTFNITGNTNPTLFSAGPTISPAGVLTYTPAASASGTASISVTLSDNGGTANGGVDTSAAQTFTITVNPINDAPSFTKGPNQTVNEDAGAQSVNPWATGISAGPADEAAQTLTFNITGNTNPGLFAAGPAVSSTGALTYTPAANANGVATISLLLRDSGGTASGGVDTSAAQTFTITINAVNDAPSFTAGPNQTVIEDSGAQTVSAWATGISAGPANEAGQTLTFNITGNTNPALFSAAPTISPAGALSYTPAAGAFGTASITVTLSDNGGTANGGADTSAARTFTITVNGVNDAPSFSGGPNQSVLEDSGAQTVAGWATAISAGPANEAGQTLSFVVTGNSNAGLFGAGPAVAANGTLTYTPAANANGVATITLVVQDNGGTANGGVDTSAAQTFTITVTPVNDPPLVTAPGPFALTGNVAISVPAPGLLSGVSDPADGAGAAPFTISGAAITSAQGGNVAVNTSTGAFSYNPPAGFEGSDSFAYQVCDSGVPGSACTVATVNLTVSGMIWFIDNAAASCTTRASGCGRLSNPYSTLAAFQAENNGGAGGLNPSANDNIFLYRQTATNYTGPLTLLSGQKLIGQGATASLSAITGLTPSTSLPATGGVRPIIAHNANNLTLGQGNTLRGFDLSNTGGTALTGNTFGTLSVLDMSVANTGGTAINLNSGDPTATFTSVSSNNATNGIVLTNTTGSFTVTGTGAAGTGGTIQNCAGPGVSLTSASAVSLAFMNVQNGADDGIRGSTVTGLSLNGVQVTNNGNAAGEAGIDLTNLFGTSTWSGVTVSGSAEDNAVIRNNSGTMNLTVTGSTFSNNSAIGNDGLLMEGLGTANMTASVTGSAFAANRGDHFQAAAGNSANLDVVFSGNSLASGHPNPLGQGITVNAAASYSGTFDYNIDNNTINGSILSAITANLGTSLAAGNMRGTISGNNIGTAGAALSCSTQANGIAIDAHGNGTHTLSVTGNTIRRCFDRGISVLANDGNGVLNLTVSGNSMNTFTDTDAANGTPREAFTLVAGAADPNIFGLPDSHAVCLSLASTNGNMVGGAFKNGDMRLRQRFRTSIRLPGYGGSAFDTAAVITFVQGNNPGTTATATSNNDAGVTTDGYFGGAACPLPP